MTYVFVIIIVFLFVYIIKTSPTHGKKQLNNSASNFNTDDSSKEELQFNVSFPDSQSKEEKKEMDDLEKKYPKWYGLEKVKGFCFERHKIEPLPNGQTEKVHYKTDRFAELFGRGKDVSYFPGYGKIYNRTFEIWHRKTGSKEKLSVIEYYDICIDKYYGPCFAEKITGGLSINNEMERTSGYLKLYNVRDEKNGITWYAGLKSKEFTGIITDREIE